jgi:hypothetical protein
MVLTAGPKPLKAPAARQEGFARGTGEQGSMYHIWAVQCQIQLRRGQAANDGRGPVGPPVRCGIKLANPVGCRVRGMQ